MNECAGSSAAAAAASRSRSLPSGTTTSAPAPARQRGAAELDQPGRPVLPRQRRPHRPGRPPLGQRLEQRRPGLVAGEPGRVRRLRQGVRRRALPLLGRGPPRREGQAQHVAGGPGVAVGDRAHQPRDLRREHRLAGGDVRERLQRAGEVGGVPELPHHAVDQPAVEPHPHPAAGLHGVLELLGDGVVEGPVQVRQGHVDDDPGHSRQARGTRVVGWSGGVQRCYAPTAERRASTRSSALPGQVDVGAAEVAVGRRRGVDRPQQVQVAHDRAGAQVEHRGDGLLEHVVGDGAGAEGLDEQADRVRGADRVGDLHLAALGQAGGDDVLGHPAHRVGRGAVDLRRVLAREGAAAVAGHAAVGVDDDLATGQPGVAHGAADDELAGRVHQQPVAVGGQAEGGQLRLDDELLDVGREQLVDRDVLGVLRGDHHGVDGDRAGRPRRRR